jgi:hypothetical protein
MTFWQSLLALLDTQMETPPSFGWFHLMWVGISFLALIPLLRFPKEQSQDHVRKVVLVTAITVIILEIYKQTPNNSREIMALPTMPQYRKIRCIVGEATFAGETEPCADSIGTCGDWRKRGPIHHMPYRTLYNKNFPNLITAGRITSATGEGWEVTRVIPVCALTGQAAGTAAAMCTKSGDNFATLNVPALQETLKAQGVLF